jgi:hypothetical protein
MSDDDGWVRVQGTAPEPSSPPPDTPAAAESEQQYAALGLGLALFSIVVPCLPVLLPLAGAVLGAMALSRGEPRRGVAIAAVVVGVLAAIGHVVALIVFID